MKSQNPETLKHLLVIPDNSAYWTLWCIDFIKKAINGNDEIIILDLRGFIPRRYDGNSRHILYKLNRKNRVEAILRKLVAQNNIELLRPRDRSHSYLPNGIIRMKNEGVTFLNALDSQYFEEVNERIVSESQLEAQFLSRATSIYDRVSSITSQVLVEKDIRSLTIPGGRTLIPTAAIAAAQNLGIPCSILEAAPIVPLAYLEYPANFRHNNQFIQGEIDRCWRNADNLKYEIAKEYLDQKLYPKDRGDLDFFNSFVDEKSLPISQDKKLAAIFVGSGFEMVPTEPIADDIEISKRRQEQIIRLFCKVARENGFKVVLRGHPPTKGREGLFEIEDKVWSRFCVENGATYLASNSGINSYKLMCESKINAVYASSAGIDSIIQGTNTVVLGNADFAHLVPELCAFDEDAIRRRFASDKLVVNIEKLYPYAFFMATSGIRVSGASISASKTLIYNGKEIGAPRTRLLSGLMKKIL